MMLLSNDRPSKSAVGVRSAYADSNIGTHRSLCFEIVSTSSAYTTSRMRFVTWTTAILVISDPNALGIIEFSQEDEDLKRTTANH